jgi:nucleoside-diphosphate-sugar epimerase
MERDVEGIFNIAYGGQHTLNELASTIMELTGKRMAPVYEPVRQGDILHSLADITAARSQLGYSPEYTFKSGLEETVSWFRKQ